MESTLRCPTHSTLSHAYPTTASTPWGAGLRVADILGAGVPTLHLPPTPQLLNYQAGQSTLVTSFNPLWAPLLIAPSDMTLSTQPATDSYEVTQSDSVQPKGLAPTNSEVVKSKAKLAYSWSPELAVLMFESVDDILDVHLPVLQQQKKCILSGHMVRLEFDGGWFGGAGGSKRDAFLVQERIDTLISARFKFDIGKGVEGLPDLPQVDAHIDLIFTGSLGASDLVALTKVLDRHGERLVEAIAAIAAMRLAAVRLRSIMESASLAGGMFRRIDMSLFTSRQSRYVQLCKRLSPLNGSIGRLQNQFNAVLAICNDDRIAPCLVPLLVARVTIFVNFFCSNANDGFKLLDTELLDQQLTTEAGFIDYFNSIKVDVLLIMEDTRNFDVSDREDLMAAFHNPDFLKIGLCIRERVEQRMPLIINQTRVANLRRKLKKYLTAPDSIYKGLVGDGSPYGIGTSGLSYYPKTISSCIAYLHTLDRLLSCTARDKLYTPAQIKKMEAQFRKFSAAINAENEKQRFKIRLAQYPVGLEPVAELPWWKKLTLFLLADQGT